MNINIGVAGYFKMEVVKPNGAVVEVAPFQKNLILDSGLDNFKTSANSMHYCHVGSGVTAPSVSDTGLEVPVAISYYTSKSNLGSGVSPHYTDTTTVHEFALGTFNGQEITEIGLGNSPTDSLLSRSLIKDGFNVPTKVIVFADEILKISYTVRIYVPEADTVVTIGAYTCTTRAGYASLTDSWNLSGNSGSALAPGSFRLLANATLGIITSTMTGTLLTTQTGTASRPTARSYRQTCSLGLGTGNGADGISGITLENTYFEFYLQTQISPPIMKTALDTLVFSFDVTWGRV
jgi:hypothetical protein